MSFASCSTRFESSPARTSDVGLHVDNARTVTSSPDATRSTGSPATSYHPHATVLGVGMSVWDLPGAGAGQSVRGAASAQTAPAGPAGAEPGEVAPTEDGVRQLNADTPLMIMPRPICRRVIRRLLRRRRSSRHSACFSAFER